LISGSNSKSASKLKDLSIKQRASYSTIKAHQIGKIEKEKKNKNV